MLKRSISLLRSSSKNTFCSLSRQEYLTKIANRYKYKNILEHDSFTEFLKNSKFDLKTKSSYIHKIGFFTLGSATRKKFLYYHSLYFRVSSREEYIFIMSDIIDKLVKEETQIKDEVKDYSQFNGEY